MTKRIFKYTLTIEDLQTVEMPEGAEILSVQNQGGDVCIWALCAPNAPKEARTFHIFGTGNPVCDNPGRFVGTVQILDGALVWHVFETEN